MQPKRVVAAFLGIGCLFAAGISARNLVAKRVGELPDGGFVLPTGLIVHPVGDVLTMPGRPVDMRFSSDGRWLFVKDIGSLRVIDVKSWKQLSSAESKDGASMVGLAVTRGNHVFFSDADHGLLEFGVSDLGVATLLRRMELPQDCYPTGISLSADERKAYVCFSVSNTLAVVDLGQGRVVEQIPVGVCPYEVKLSADEKSAFVSNMGGRRARPGHAKEDSAGTDVEVDKYGTAESGSVSVIDLSTSKVKTEISTDLQPTDLLVLDRQTVLVAQSNADSVGVIDLKANKVVRNINVKPDTKLPFGSMPNALTISPDHKTLFVANGGNNAIGIVDISNLAKPRVQGFVPTGWYPSGVAVNNGTLFILNNKGSGARLRSRAADKGWNSRDRMGSLQKLPIPTGNLLASLTKQVRTDGNVPQVLAAYERGNSRTAAKPIPAKPGDPSVFKHVIYVIKENRTYDQILGDLPFGERDPSLCIFGEKVTPNEHAIAKQFVTLDNYYCNGVLSADGHAWAIEANVTPYLNRQFGGFKRTYDYGNDPITLSRSGRLWDRVLDAGLSFRNYGETGSVETENGKSGKQIYEDYVAGKKPKLTYHLELANLMRYSCPDYPGWNMDVPDQYRMDVFMREFREFEQKNLLPNLIVLYLPQDHTGGAYLPSSHVADNDLAVGRLLDAVSHSKFWKDTAIFINEDDPQAGFDHIDGHRSICFVASAYTKRGAVVSDFYNQTSVVHTMLQILGLPPLNQKDAQSPLMTTCFQDKLDLTPYSVVANQTPLDATSKSSALSSTAAKLAAQVAKLDLSKREVQTGPQMDLMNRFLWHSVNGKRPYPGSFAGAHGRGLAKMGLKLMNNVVDED